MTALAKTAFANALFGLTIAAQPAFAQETRAVDYADLDLSTPHGQSAFDARLRSAARGVCGIGTDRASLNEQVSERTCYNSALNNARAKFASIKRGPVHSR
ncbi:UrcA family protein [Novosphingobium sp. SCN 63-17]|uniref:UrcA family protein n=1 Tax=Novosphingobium sp. SCN 63-17 TaxID=1660120 RepID=UPI00086A1D93|nr:UrcA family protein [Novosphingobium sp. SCN 63-17]ODU80112.1 MAG: hypothetical protein ABT10_18895 [Novosphingobium sp. SCN 63-17]